MRLKFSPFCFRNCQFIMNWTKYLIKYLKLTKFVNLIVDQHFSSEPRVKSFKKFFQHVFYIIRYLSSSHIEFNKNTRLKLYKTLLILKHDTSHVYDMSPTWSSKSWTNPRNSFRFLTSPNRNLCTYVRKCLHF